MKIKEKKLYNNKTVDRNKPEQQITTSPCGPASETAAFQRLKRYDGGGGAEVSA